MVKKRLRQSSESEPAAKRPAEEVGRRTATAGPLAERSKPAARFRPAFFRTGDSESRVPGASPLRDYNVFNPVGGGKPGLAGPRSCPQPLPPPCVPPPLLAAMSAGLPAPAERRDVQINEVSSSSSARQPPPPGHGEDSDTENQAAPPARPPRRPPAAASGPVGRSPSAELLQRVRRKTDEWSQQVRQLRSSLSTPQRTRRSALRSHNGQPPPPPAARKRRSSDPAPERPAKKPLTRSRIRLGK